MNMSAHCRRIRIHTRKEALSPHARFVEVTDMETGEEITNIVRIKINLEARGNTLAYITAIPRAWDGRVLQKNGKPIMETYVVEDVELDIIALEGGDASERTRHR